MFVSSHRTIDRFLGVENTTLRGLLDINIMGSVDSFSFKEPVHLFFLEDPYNNRFEHILSVECPT